MQVTKIIPPRHRNVIHSVWRIDLDQEKIKNGYYYLPDNYSEIIISLKSNLKRMVVGTPQVAKIDKGGCYLATTRSKGTMLMSAEDTSFVLIKLHPIRQHMVYGSKDFQTRNGVYDIPIPVTEKLAWDRAIAKTDATTITHLICNFLDVLIDAPTRKMDKVVKKSIDIIKQQKGEIKVKDLNIMVGVCKSTLEQKFNREIGLSPKEYCKIEKLNHFLSNYKLNKEMSLTQLTFKCGYYDQSHLIKDFRYFVDLSPKKFLKDVNNILL